MSTYTYAHTYTRIIYKQTHKGEKERARERESGRERERQIHRDGQTDRQNHGSSPLREPPHKASTLTPGLHLEF